MKAPTPRGFTLIEALVALFLIGLILVMFQATLKNMPLIKLAKNQDKALKIVSSELEELRAGGHDALPATGSFSDTALTTLPSGSGMVTVSTVNAATKQVTVTVTWREQNATTDSTVSLTTLITDIGGL